MYANKCFQAVKTKQENEPKPSTSQLKTESRPSTSQDAATAPIRRFEKYKAGALLQLLIELIM